MELVVPLELLIKVQSALPLKLLFRPLPRPGSVGIQLVRKLKIGGRAFLGWNQGPVTWYNYCYSY